MLVFLGLVIAVFAIACYWPALHGPFALDDEPNFYGLRFVDDVNSALAYSYSGPSGTRWLSYLSFTLPVEIDGWKQGNAFAFKLINLLIHGFNTLLVYVVVKQLLASPRSTFSNPSLWAAGIALVWAIHPIHVSTVLYSVQRMTLMSTTAVMAGLWFHFYFLGRRPPGQALSLQEWLAYTATVWLITLAGILCKETAILLPLFILASQALVPSPLNRLQTSVTLLMPYVALGALLILQNKLGYGTRDFTMGERLMSQVVILKEYAEKIVLPGPHSFSLYYDDFHPVRTPGDPRLLLAAVFWLGIVLLARLGDRRMPGLWLGCLWFLAGHALESTIIPLELYFDHRNYLPSLGIMLMLATGLNYAVTSSTRKVITCLLILAVLALVGRYLFILNQETASWKDDNTLAESLIIKHPDSLRATQHYIETLVSQGRFPEAILMVDHIYTKFGVYPSNALYQVGFSCIAYPENPIKHQKLANDLKTLPMDKNVGIAMQFLLELIRKDTCPAILDWNAYKQYTNSLLENRRQRRHLHNLVFLLVSSYMYQKDFATALEHSYRLPKRLRTPQFVFLQMHLALDTRNLAAAETLFADIQAFDRPDKILHKTDIEKIASLLEQLRRDQSP